MRNEIERDQKNTKKRYENDAIHHRLEQMKLNKFEEKIKHEPLPMKKFASRISCCISRPVSTARTPPVIRDQPSLLSRSRFLIGGCRGRGPENFEKHLVKIQIENYYSVRIFSVYVQFHDDKHS